MKIQAALRTAVLIGLVLARAFGQSTCVTFPSGFIPFSSISYVTAANSAGDHLVVGVPASGALNAIANNIPAPAFVNQTFCDAQVQLAPQQFYPNVYVPTAAELSGNFNAFAGLLLNPTNNQPFPNGVIPAGQLNNVFAWRIGAAQAASASRGWSPTSSMTEPRTEHAAVLLPSGKVLVVGGNGDTASELYDPLNGTFTPTGRTLFVHSNDVTATLLNNGNVLLVGGRGAPAAAELYDPASGQFSATGSPIQPHGFYHTATLLNDGRVLVVGGVAAAGNGGLPTDSDAGAEIYDPKTGAFTKAGPMAFNRCKHTATLLADGRVVVTGGQTGVFSAVQFDSAEVFNPATGQFALTSPMAVSRDAHFAVLLPSGKVLVGGGDGPTAGLSAELFDPSTMTFTLTGEMSTPRALASVTLLSSGQVLVPGGYSDFPTGTSAVELYNPATGTFTTTGSMAFPRGNATATLLLDGRVLVTGGQTVCCAGVLSNAELYTSVIQGLETSQTGLTFRVAQGSTNLSPQSVAVLSATDTIPWTLSTHTYQGGSWLSVSPTSGTSGPSTAPVVLSISANPAGLAAQDYYGEVILKPTDGKHPSISIAIVLSIVPAGAIVPPGVAPSGLVFLADSGGSVGSQSFVISNFTSMPITFTGVSSPSSSWFDFSPKSGTITGAQTTPVTVTPSIAKLTPGVYPGSIMLTFGDGSTQTIDLLLVISANTASPTTTPPAPAPAAATAGCTATKLLPVFTTIATGLSTPAAWPTPIEVQVVDDCGAAFNNGTVIVSFSDGDSPINLLSLGNGNWAGTWVPARSATGITVRADAQQLPLSGSVQVILGVSTNPTVPVVGAGGVVSSGDFTSSPALGLLVSIFGSGLAGGTVEAKDFPLPEQLGSTSVVLSGRVLPLLYVSDGQVNAVIPFDIQENSSQQLTVLNGFAASVPVATAVFDTQPSILTVTGSASGQGLIYKVDANGNAVLADANAPASAGDVLVMYAVGLGVVKPSIAIQNGAPGSPLSDAVAPVSATIGGVSATVAFAGLTPGFVGLYQLNLTVPGGVLTGSSVPVTVSVAGKSNSGSVYMAVQ